MGDRVPHYLAYFSARAPLPFPELLIEICKGFCHMMEEVGMHVYLETFYGLFTLRQVQGCLSFPFICGRSVSFLRAELPTRELEMAFFLYS